jgi:hypothetical protein
VFATEGREHQVVDAFARFLGAHGGDPVAVREVSCDMSPVGNKYPSRRNPMVHRE